ncbi:Protein of unknown function [Pyronema omphalodes CBS 100304]|nr:Protein of unknown function [Pyronema omphalodes CBS 100304]
MGYVER